MTSRKPEEKLPRDSRLRLVRAPQPMQARPLATARRAVTDRRTRPAPRPPAGTPPPAELARQARAVLADAVRVARWTDAERARGGACGPGRPGPLPAPVAERAAAALGLTPGAGAGRAGTAPGSPASSSCTAPPCVPAGGCAPGTATTAPSCAAGSRSSTPGRSSTPPRDDIAPTAVAEVVEAVPQVLSLLQLSAGPVLVPALLDLLEQRVAELREERCEVPYGPAARRARGPGPPVPTPLLPPLLDWALEGLAAVGALDPRRGPGHPDPARQLGGLGQAGADLRRRAEPGRQHRAVRRGHAARLRGPHPRPGPRRVPRLARRPHRRQRRHRTPRRRPAATTRCCAGSPSRRCGSSGHPPRPAVRAAADETSLRPYALLWLAEYEGGDPEDVLERPHPRGGHLAVGGHRRRRRRPRRERTAGPPPRLGGAGHGARAARRGAGRRPPPHRAGPGRPGRRAPRPGAGQGGAPGRLPGAHRVPPSERRAAARGRAAVGADAAPGPPRSSPGRPAPPGTYVPKLHTLPSASLAM